MNLGEMHEVIRDTLESDNDEFSDSLLNTWIREAWLYVHRFADWPFLDTTWTLATALPAVDFGQITDPRGAVPKSLHSVRAVSGELGYLVPDQIQGILARGASGSPQYWSVRGGRTLLIAPEPSSTADYIIQGFRAPLDWLSGGLAATPDLPEGLHIALYQWALGRAFQRLDEPQSSTHYLDMAQFTIESVDVDTSSAQFGGSIVVGGGGLRDRDTNTAPLLREPTTRVVLS